MSDVYLRIIPMVPNHVPGADAAQLAEDHFRKLFPEAEQVSARSTADVRFVDCGANLERVLCPDCGNDLLMDGRWQQLMDTAHQSRFAELDVVLPCCGRTASLNEMRYDSPCGFARFVLEARNPGQALADQDLSLMAVELGCPVRAIWARV